MGSSNSIRAAARMMMALAAASAVAHASPAWAGRKTSSTLVRLNVKSACSVQANDLLFGFPPKAAKTAIASTTIRVNCTPGVQYRVGIDNGVHFANGSRRMYGGQANGVVWYAPYRLFRDPARLLPLDNSLVNSLLGTMSPAGTRTFTVYGIADLKSVRAAEYHDTVTVVVDF